MSKPLKLIPCIIRPTSPVMIQEPGGNRYGRVRVIHIVTFISMIDGQGSTQSAISDSPAASSSLTNDARNDNQSPVKRRRSMSVQSLVSRNSFASVYEEGEIQQLSQEMVMLRERVDLMDVQNEGFQKDAVMLVKQVSESLGMLDGSRLKNEKRAEVQQQQMEALLTQTQGLIAQCQTTTAEMKQQQVTLNAEFDKLGEWETRVETELIVSKGTQEVLGKHLSHVQEQSQSSMGALRSESQQNLGNIREELKDMRKVNRERTPIVHGMTQSVFDGVKVESPTELSNQQQCSLSGAQSKPCAQTVSGAQPNICAQNSKSENHAPTQDEQHAPTHLPFLGVNRGENVDQPAFAHQFVYPPQMNQTGLSYSQWIVPNGMIDSCPTFTANLYQNWCREVKLRRQAQVGANPTQIIAKIVSTLPTNSRMEILAYLENTESNPESRSVDKVMEILNHRFGRTDTERAWSWLSSFTEFKRDASENFKDFWTRFTRCVTRLHAHGLAMSEAVVFHRAIQALRLPEGEIISVGGNRIESLTHFNRQWCISICVW